MSDDIEPLTPPDNLGAIIADIERDILAHTIPDLDLLTGRRSGVDGRYAEMVLRAIADVRAGRL